MILTVSLLILTGCTANSLDDNAEGKESVILTQEEQKEEGKETVTMKMKIGTTSVDVVWEENEAVDALKEIVKENTMVIQMSMYGGFEQVGSLGFSIPRNDMQTVTEAGDIVLYSGNQIVVFYGSNSWSYTRLGKINGKSREELEQLLGQRDVEIIISME